MTAIPVPTWDNESGPGGAINTSRSLTHSLDETKEELPMDATRKIAHPTHAGSPASYQRRAQARYAAVNSRIVSPWAIIETGCEYDMCLRAECMTVLEPVKLSYAPGQCVYCGEPSSGYDHLMPRAWTGEQVRKQVAIVPCCAHCNSVINDTLAVSVSERRDVCHKRLRKNNQRILQSPDRQPWEYLQMGYVLRESAKAWAIKKQRLLARLSWPVDPDYDRRAFEKSGIEFAVERGLA